MEEYVAVTVLEIKYLDEKVDVERLFHTLQKLKAKDYLKLYQLMYSDLIENQSLKIYKEEDYEVGE